MTKARKSDGFQLLKRHRAVRRVLVVLAALGIILSFAPAAASASTFTWHGAQVKKVEYCNTVIEKIRPGEPDSRVVSQTCSDNPADAKAPAATVILATFFEDANYIGYNDNVSGKDGPCDASGYGISDLTGVEANVNGISSYYYFNSCNTQRLYSDTYYGGNQAVNHGDNANVGQKFNDNLWSMRLWKT